MKKLLICFIIVMAALSPAFARHSCGHHGCRHSSYSSHRSYGSGSEPAYIINRDYKTHEIKFPNCKEHYVIEEVTTNIYSDGSKRVYRNSTIYNSDGSVLLPDCMSVEHIVYNDKHYFVVHRSKVNKGWQIIHSNGQPVTSRNYSFMSVIKPDRILVRIDKRYGVINLDEKVIIPIKYKKFTEVSDGVFLTKLNGYWGVLNLDNEILIKNDCEKIKILYDTLIIKRYGKYGLADLKGRILYEPKYDKIKKMGEYILIYADKKYTVLNMEGKPVSAKKYTKLRLIRNDLEGETVKNKYEKISDPFNIYKLYEDK